MTGVGVECPMKVACQAWSVGLSDIKRSVHAMKVDPHVHELELSDSKYAAGNKKDQLYCPSTADTNNKRRWDEDDGWLRGSGGPGSRTRWASSRLYTGTGTQSPAPGSIMDLETSELHKKHWSNLCLYLGRCDDGEQGRHDGVAGTGDDQGEVQALHDDGVQACDQQGGARAGGARDEDGLAQGGGDVDGRGDLTKGGLIVCGKGRGGLQSGQKECLKLGISEHERHGPAGAVEKGN